MTNPHATIYVKTNISSHHSIQFRRSRKLHYLPVSYFGTNLNVLYFDFLFISFVAFMCIELEFLESQKKILETNT